MSSNTLPKPERFVNKESNDDSECINYHLESGHIIRNSKTPGKWFVWIKDGEELNHSGVPVPYGHHMLDSQTGIKYWNSAEEVLNAINNGEVS